MRGGGRIVEMVDVDGYLRRLAIESVPGPTVDGLFALHRAHVETVPYETLEIQLGRPTTVDPESSAARIIAGRGGYCYHLNGAFSLLLSALGFDVSRHVGGVFSNPETAVGASGSHLALTVRVGDLEWFVDVGLGDALYSPMPLRVGAVRQGPFTYRLERSPMVDGGWRFWHAPEAGSFAGMDFAPAPVDMDAFAAMHTVLSTSPESNFMKVAQVGRRTATGTEFLAGCFLRRYAGGRLHRRVLTSADEWYDVIEQRFGMSLADVDAAAKTALWDRVYSAHTAYVAPLNTASA